MRTANKDLRVEGRKAGVYLWMIAEHLDISEPTGTC
jgi:hypothetical protein